jgi:hypothetical protein
MPIRMGVLTRCIASRGLARPSQCVSNNRVRALRKHCKPEPSLAAQSSKSAAEMYLYLNKFECTLEFVRLRG